MPETLLAEIGNRPSEDLASSALSTSPDLAMTRIIPRYPSERTSLDPAPSVSGGLGRAKVGDPRATISSTKKCLRANGHDGHQRLPLPGALSRR